MAGKWIATAALVVLGASPAVIPRLGVTFPVGLPAVEGWERITGELEVAEPHTLVQYEFFVNPRRQALYEVVRYRITPLGPAPGAEPVTEKVQWDRGRRDLLRFQCVPVPRALRSGAGRAAPDGCAWQEMAKGSPAYVGETATLMWLYGLHRRVVLEREAGKQ